MKLPILITGIHGFVGSNLVQALQGHHTLYGLDIVSPQAIGVIKAYGWDALQDVPPVNTIIHLAGKAHDTKNTSSAQSYFDINLGLTQKIFDYFLQSQAEKFIFFSSVKAVADTVEGELLTEENIPNPQTPYGQSKLAAEQYITEAYTAWLKENQQTEFKIQDSRFNPSADGQDSEITNPQSSITNPQSPITNQKSLYILRPCMIHGPGNKGNLNLLYKIVQKGIPWPLGAFSNQRSFLSIDNLTFVLQRIIETDLAPGTYQLADDTPLSTNNLIQLIATSLNRKPKIWHLNKGFVNILAKTGDKLHLPLNSERLKKLTENYVVSNQKIKDALGIDKMPVDAVSGMKKTLQSFNTAK